MVEGYGAAGLHGGAGRALGEKADHPGQARRSGPAAAAQSHTGAVASDARCSTRLSAFWRHQRALARRPESRMPRFAQGGAERSAHRDVLLSGGSKGLALDYRATKAPRWRRSPPTPRPGSRTLIDPGCGREPPRHRPDRRRAAPQFAEICKVRVRRPDRRSVTVQGLSRSTRPIPRSGAVARP